MTWLGKHGIGEPHERRASLFVTALQLRAWSYPVDRALMIFTFALCLGLFGVLATPLLTGRVPVFGDHGCLYLPIRAFYAECLARGYSFDWIPQLSAGYPAAGTELGPYHPGHWLLYRFLPIDFAYSLEVAAPHLFGLLGLWVFLTPYVGAAAASVGALLLTFSLVSLQWVLYPHMVAVLAHIPWLLWATGRAVSSQSVSNKILSGAFIAILTGSQFLLAHPQSTWFSLLAVGAYVLFLTLNQRLDWSGFLAICVGNLVGFLIGSVQTYAMYAALASSSRASSTPDMASVYSLEPNSLWASLVPAIYWDRSWNGIAGGEHFGTVPVVLVLSYVAARATDVGRASASSRLGLPGRTKLAIFGWSVAALALWLALGGKAYLYRLQAWLPVIGKLRAPARFVALVQLGLTLVSAVVVSQLIDAVAQRRPIAWRSLWLPWMFVALSIVAAGYGYLHGPAASSTHFQTSFLMGPLMAIAATLALTFTARGHAIGLFLLVLVAVFESFAYGFLFERVARPSWRDTPRFHEWVAAMPRPPDSRPGRVLIRDFFGDQLLLAGSHFVNGYLSGLEVNKRLKYDSLNVLRASGTAWVFHRGFDPDPQISGVSARGNGWWSVDRPLPRMRLIQHALVSRDESADLQSIDVRTAAVVENRLEPPLKPGTIRGSVSIADERPGYVHANVTVHGRELLFLAESISRDWKATVDGAAAKVWRVNGDFMGCIVEAGQHEVVFAYRPRRLWRAERVSMAAGLLACLTVLVVGLLRQRGFMRRSPAKP
jgi:hypothetical protein